MSIKTTLTIAKKWAEDAIADGWRPSPIYPNHEPVESAMSLTDGIYKASIIMRSDKDSSVAVWTMDDISVDVNEVYNREELNEASKTCCICNQKVEKTVRLAFANRCCQDCRKKPEVLQKNEPRGWCD